MSKQSCLPLVRFSCCCGSDQTLPGLCFSGRLLVWWSTASINTEPLTESWAAAVTGGTVLSDSRNLELISDEGGHLSFLDSAVRPQSRNPLDQQG